MLKKEKILLGLSGGVDSSVSGALLKKKGYSVEAGFMCNYRDRDPRCSYPIDKKWSLEVAKFLKIPWHEFNFEPIYKRRVLDYFYSEYQKGRTPNPDMFCNRFVKFAPFLKEAAKLGASHVAFGHYARTKKITEKELNQMLGLAKSKTPSKKHTLLLRGKDPSKDQSYFLAQLTEKQLQNIIFPVGGFFKKHVRKLARDFKLPSRERKDSTGICSVGQLDPAEFLKRRIKEKKGPILNTSGKKVGEHNGIFFYTIGQRKGFGLALGKPYYIVGKDLKRNALIVAEVGDKRISSLWLDVKNILWINGAPKLPYTCDVQVRYRQRAMAATISKITGGVRVKFKQPVWGAARGQFAVFYGALKKSGAREVVLGSGTIEKTEGEEEALRTGLRDEG